MTFTELLGEVKKLKHEEVRTDTPEFFEMVIAKDSLTVILPILDKFFGRPIKPANIKPSGEARKAADPYGGIRSDQTLYYLEDGGKGFYGMLWPWGSGVLVTLKLIRGK